MPDGATDARCRCHVHEAAASVPEKVIRADGGHEKIGPAIVVVVPDRGAHPVQVDGQTGCDGHVREVPAAVVAVQGQPRSPRTGGPRRPGPRPRVHEEQIRKAVIVVVEESHAAAHRFRQQFLAVGAVFVLERDAGLPRDVDERDIRRRDRRGSTANRKRGSRRGHRWPPAERQRNRERDDDQSAQPNDRPGRAGHRSG
jgi:hypothetical protein